MLVLGIAVFFAADGWSGWNLLQWAAGLSTERAQEMQKGSCQLSVLGSQFSVLSSQFSVVSCQFSVLSFQFSVTAPKSVAALWIAEFTTLDC